MRVIRLTAENVKRLRAVDITPPSGLVVVTGKNSQGKTSVLDSIFLALRGSDAAKEITKPIREGETKASVELHLGDYIVRRNWTSNDQSYLKVETKDGAKVSSPQTLLDNLVGKISFDPLQFSRLDAKEQRRVLLEIVQLPVDPVVLDLQKQKMFDERTGVNREAKTIQAQMQSVGPWNEETPDEPVALDAVTNDWEEASGLFERNRALRSNLQLANEQLVRDEDTVRRLRQELETAEAKLETRTKQVRLLEKDVVTLQDPDLDAIKKKMRDRELINQAVGYKKQYRNFEKKVAELKNQTEDLTIRMMAIENSKRDMLANAEFPLVGLSVSGDSVLFNGIPFLQCAASEQLKISLAIAMTLNPRLRVIRISDGSLLDEDNLELVRQVAEANDFQVWMECVGNEESIGILIEDGEVKANTKNEFERAKKVEGKRLGYEFEA